MWGKAKTLVLAAVVVSAALVPLFGDPRVTPVTHPLWARMLLRSMEMTQAVRTSSEASQVFNTLAWRDSLTFPADEFLRSDGAVVREEAGEPVVAPGEGPAEVVYAVAVAQPGDYQLRARLAGAPGTPATAEPTIRAIGFNPCRSTAESDAINSAADPSLMPEALPAVTVPFSRKAGPNRDRDSMVESGRGCSSSVTSTADPLRRGTDTGTISEARRPFVIAVAAFCWLESAKRS